MKIKVFLISLIIATAVAQKFLIYGDSGSGLSGQKEVADAMVKESGMEFLVHVGDVIYPNKRSPDFNKYWKTLYDRGNIKDKTHYVALGNHEYMGDVDKHLSYSRSNSRYYLRDRCYLFRRGKISFFVIDTTPLQSDYWRRAEYQRELKKAWSVERIANWLKENLERESRDPTHKNNIFVVIGHHPVYYKKSDVSFYSNGKVREYIKRYKVAAYLTGHYHSMHYLGKSEETHHFLSGSAGYGKTPPSHCKDDGSTFICDGVPGYMIARVTSDSGLEVKLKDKVGNTLKTVRLSNPRRSLENLNNKNDNNNSKDPFLLELLNELN